MSNAATGPAADEDALDAHLFLCLENGHYAVSTDPSGANLPADRCISGWKHIKAFSLGVREALPHNQPGTRHPRDPRQWLLRARFRPPSRYFAIGLTVEITQVSEEDLSSNDHSSANHRLRKQSERGRLSKVSSLPQDKECLLCSWKRIFRSIPVNVGFVPVPDLCSAANC